MPQAHLRRCIETFSLNARLGMGHTFIHDRFGSKKAFWTAVVDYAIDQVTREVSTALGGEDQDDIARLIASVRAFHQVAARRPHLTAWSTTRRPASHLACSISTS